MYKRVKKVNLNTSDKGHNKLMLVNLFTSLLLSGKIVTTEKRAKTLKSYAQKQLAYFAKNKDKLGAIARKTWLQQHISATGQTYKQAMEKLQQLAGNAKISIIRHGFRKGDGALLYEVRILNFEQENKNE